MTKPENQEAVSLFATIYDSVRTHGLAKVIKTLEDLNMRGDDLREEMIDLIIFKTCDAYQTTKKEVMESHKRGKIIMAKETIFILFKTHLDLTNVEIANHFKRDEKVVRMALQKFEALNKEIKSDAEFSEKFEELDAFIDAKKKELVTKYAQKK